MADEIPLVPAPVSPTPTPATPPPTPAAEGGVLPPREGSPLGAPAIVPAVDEKKPEGESAPEGEKKPEGEKPEGEVASVPTAEEIAKAIELPEGVTADEALMGEFSTFAAEAKLTTEQAQGLAAMYFKAQDTLVSKLAEANQKTWDTTIDGWKAEIETDPTIGGAHKEAAQQVLGKALDEYGTPEARRAFEVTGAGWNPAIIKFVHKMALALTEGGPVLAPGPARQAPKTIGQALYPEGGGGTPSAN